MRPSIVSRVAAACGRLILPGLALLWVGCAHVDRAEISPTRETPAFKYDMTGIPHSFKRIERYPQVDFFHHFVRKAYYKPSHAPVVPMGSDQERTLAEWGLPNWMRKSFRSVNSDWVQEWIYTDQHHLFQFVKGELVYDGPLTDFEQILMMRGYPNTAEIIDNTPGHSIYTLIYENYFWPIRLEEFHFVNDVMTQSQEGI